MGSDDDDDSSSSGCSIGAPATRSPMPALLGTLLAIAALRRKRRSR